MRHALDVGAGFRIAELGRPRHAEDQFLLALADLAGALIDQRGEMFGPVGKEFLAGTQGQHVARPGAELDAVDRLGQEIVGTAEQGFVADVPSGRWR